MVMGRGEGHLAISHSLSQVYGRGSAHSGHEGEERMPGRGAVRITLCFLTLAFWGSPGMLSKRSIHALSQRESSSHLSPDCPYLLKPPRDGRLWQVFQKGSEPIITQQVCRQAVRGKEPLVVVKCLSKLHLLFMVPCGHCVDCHCYSTSPCQPPCHLTHHHSHLYQLPHSPALPRTGTTVNQSSRSSAIVVAFRAWIPPAGFQESQLNQLFPGP